MKKIIISLLTAFIFTISNVNSVKAYDVESVLSDYYSIINIINEKYDSNLVIYNKSEFINSEISSKYNFDYNSYLDKIIKTDLKTFEEDCIRIAAFKPDTLEVNIKNYLYSTLSSKTVKFNSSRNSMTLTYKHNGATFDTAYKPTVKVNKLSSTYYFVMSSYTGTFKNSNKTYSVNAKGKIYTSFGISDSKTFIVNFNL